MTKAVPAYAEDVKQNYDHKYIVITPRFQPMKNTKILPIFVTYQSYN